MLHTPVCGGKELAQVGEAAQALGQLAQPTACEVQLLQGIWETALRYIADQVV